MYEIGVGQHYSNVGDDICTNFNLVLIRVENTMWYDQLNKICWVEF